MQTLSDLLSSFQLYAVCVPCSRMVALNVAELSKRLGTRTPLHQIRRRVRCAQCGKRSADIRIVYVGPCGSAAGFHYPR